MCIRDRFKIRALLMIQSAIHRPKPPQFTASRRLIIIRALRLLVHSVTRVLGVLGGLLRHLAVLVHLTPSARHDRLCGLHPCTAAVSSTAQQHNAEHAARTTHGGGVILLQHMQVGQLLLVRLLGCLRRIKVLARDLQCT
eukprot:TRINITY_DN752_c0_g2_i1.p1 TRINITY_DN752_c0_g2~~TRINITY_DN752_c0_g2_i1.p1  ORF type:complete len:140 (-),score=7.11 TRINITY_DN752_c0_g2_i1:215-634(-)